MKIYLKNKILNFTRWLYVKSHRILEKDAQIIAYTKYRDFVNVDFSCTNKNTLVASALILVKKLVTWNALTPSEIKIAKELLIEDMGYKVTPALPKRMSKESKALAPLPEKKSQISQLIQPAMIGVCINGLPVPLVTSFTFNADTQENLVTATMEYLHPNYYKEQQEHFGEATKYKVEVYVEGIRRKGFITVFDVVFNPTKLDKDSEFIYGYFKTFEKRA